MRLISLLNHYQHFPILGTQHMVIPSSFRLCEISIFLQEEV